MSNREIPHDFLEVAEKLLIPHSIAVEAYYLFRNKRNWDHVAKKLASHLGVGFDVARQLLKNCRREYFRNLSDPKAPVDASLRGSKVEYQTLVQEARESLERIVGEFQDTKPQRASKRQCRSFAVAGDFHIPFASKEAVATLLDDPSDGLIIMGDYLDLYSASKYRRNPQYDAITISRELAAGRAIMESLASKFSVIMYLKGGNHDLRALRRVQDLIPQIMPLIVNPMDVVCSGLSNVEAITSVVPGTSPVTDEGADIEMDFYSVLWDGLFGHFENFCGVDAPRRLDSWLASWSHILGLPADLSLVAQAHVHRLSMEYTPTGRQLLSTGCMALPQEYQIYGHGKYQPPTLGYVRVHVEDGFKIDTSKTELVKI
jgi:hypothetical protein